MVWWEGWDGRTGSTRKLGRYSLPVSQRTSEEILPGSSGGLSVGICVMGGEAAADMQVDDPLTRMGPDVHSVKIGNRCGNGFNKDR